MGMNVVGFSRSCRIVCLINSFIRNLTSTFDPLTRMIFESAFGVKFLNSILPYR